MGAERVEMHLLQDLVRLHREKRGRREVARILGISPNTEKKYRRALQAEGLMEGNPATLPEAEVLRNRGIGDVRRIAGSSPSRYPAAHASSRLNRRAGCAPPCDCPGDRAAADLRGRRGSAGVYGAVRALPWLDSHAVGTGL